MQLSQKLKRATLSLFGIMGVQLLGLLYSFYWKAQLLSQNDLFTQAGITPVHMFDFSTAFGVLMIVGTFIASRELKKENPWAWVAAIFIFLLSLGGFGIVFGVYGLLMIMHRDVRDGFWPKLQAAIDAI